MAKVNLDFIGLNSKITKDNGEGELEVFVQSHKMVLSIEEMTKIRKITEEMAEKIDFVINN